MRNLFVGALGTLGLALPVMAAPAAPRTTTVRAGEDCQAIVRRVYGTTAGAMARFHAANPQLGGLPHVLRAGDLVSIPPLDRKPEEGRQAETRERQQGATLSRAAEPARLGHVSAGVRTRAPGEGWTEALPDQIIVRKTRVQTGEAGVEIRLSADIAMRLDGGGELLVESMALGKRPAVVELSAGSLLVNMPKGAELTVRTAGGQLRLRGTARIAAVGVEARVAVYAGNAEARGRGPAQPPLEIRAGAGAELRLGQRPQPLAILQPPSWIGDAPLLQTAQGGVEGPLHGGRLPLPFATVAGARRYLVEVARDDRFSDRRGGGATTAPPFLTTLPPGTYYARVSAIGEGGIAGPPSAPRRLEIVPLRSDARPAPEPGIRAGAPALERDTAATVTLPPTGRPVEISLDGGPLQDCAGGCSLRLGPGAHRLALRVGDARAEVPIEIRRPAPPEPATVEPAELPVPLSTPGFPGRALHPRTRAYALFSFGAALPGRSVDTLRLDLGGEAAFFAKRFSLEASLPLLYHDSGLTGGVAVGDLNLGFRAVPLSAAGGRLSVGPLLRMQLPTGNFARPSDPGERPVVLDPALGGSAIVGRVGLLTTQGPTVVLNLPATRLRWSMSYAAEVRVWRVSFAAALDAAIGMLEGSGSGVALGGGVRLHMGRLRVLGFGRGGLGPGGRELFGRYQTGIGVEWVR